METKQLLDCVHILQNFEFENKHPDINAAMVTTQQDVL